MVRTVLAAAIFAGAPAFADGNDAAGEVDGATQLPEP